MKKISKLSLEKFPKEIFQHALNPSPAVVAWFLKASVFHSVNSAPSENGAWVWYPVSCLKWTFFKVVTFSGKRLC